MATGGSSISIKSMMDSMIDLGGVEGMTKDITDAQRRIDIQSDESKTKGEL